MMSPLQKSHVRSRVSAVVGLALCGVVLALCVVSAKRTLEQRAHNQAVVEYHKERSRAELDAQTKALKQHIDDSTAALKRWNDAHATNVTHATTSFESDHRTDVGAAKDAGRIDTGWEIGMFTEVQLDPRCTDHGRELGRKQCMYRIVRDTMPRAHHRYLVQSALVDIELKGKDLVVRPKSNKIRCADERGTR